MRMLVTLDCCVLDAAEKPIRGKLYIQIWLTSTHSSRAKNKNILTSQKEKFTEFLLGSSTT